MQILSITSKEENLYVEDELMKSQEMFPDCENIVVQDYEDIISHDNYLVTQEQPGEIKDLVIFENQGSSYVFDRTKTGSSNTCFRVDLYNNDVFNPNSIVNILSFLEKGRWFDNSIICADDVTIRIIKAIVKEYHDRERLIENISNNTHSEVGQQVDVVTNVVFPGDRPDRVAQQTTSDINYTCPVYSVPYLLDSFSRRRNMEHMNIVGTYYFPSGFLRSKKRGKRKKAKGACLVQ